MTSPGPTRAVRSASALVDLAARVRADSRVVSGGLPLWRKPIALLRTVAEGGCAGLSYSSFLASLDAELLAAAGSLASLEYGYVGRDLLGSSRLLASPMGFERHPRTEFEYWAAVRASAAGLPDLPDAFGGPVPAVRYDTCLLHAAGVDARGNVYCRPLDLMEEDDLLLVETADELLVTVEEQYAEPPADAVLLVASDRVTAFAVCPGGAAPLGMAGFYPPDLDTFEAERFGS